MKSCKLLITLLLVAGVVCGLAACGEKPDLGKNPLTLEKIRDDLSGKSVSGLSGGELLIEGPLYVEEKGIEYAGRIGNARLLLRTVNPKSKRGVDGEVRAEYEYRVGQWHLQKLEADTAAEMSPPYAERLVELLDFPLHFAANIGDREGVARALEQGTLVDAPEAKKSSSALMFAAERGFLPIVTLLVEGGANVNYKNRYGYTALHASVSGGHLEVARYLVDKGADVQATEEKGRTPLFFAIGHNDLDSVRLLKEHGADLNVRDKTQWTPLFAAIEKNAVEIARYLIEQGVPVKSNSGAAYSPLLAAAYYGNVEMVKLLLEAGADVSVRMSKGHMSYQNQSALDIAQRQGHADVVELLKQAGAQ